MSWPVGRHRVYRICSALTGYPRLILLLALGWRIEGSDDRYGSITLSRDETR
jgi:hypothetical protein